MQVGEIVRIRKDAYPDDAMKHVMYAGWYAVVMQREGVMAYLDSDEFTRKTGQLQAVSFRGWFSVAKLEEAKGE